MTAARRRLARLIMAAFATALLSASVGCATDVQSGIDRANDLLYRKQYVASDRLFRKLLRRLEDRGELDEAEDAQRLVILDRLGKLNALYLHDYNAAIAYFHQLVRIYPKTDQAFAARATVADVYHHKLGDLQAAIEAYHKLVSEFPDRPDSRRAQLQITSAYFQLKNYEQARTEAEQVIERWPKSKEATQARFQIANSYYVQTRYAEAIATYERLLEAKPDLEVASLVLFELGNCFQGLDQSERALAYYYACLQDHPDPVLVQRKIRRVRTRMHRTRPLPEIYLPEYLKERLAAAASPGTVTPHAQSRVSGTPTATPRTNGGSVGPATTGTPTPRPTPKATPDGATEPKPGTTGSDATDATAAPEKTPSKAKAKAKAPAPEEAAPAPAPKPKPKPEPAPAAAGGDEAG